MERLTTDNPNANFQTMMNYAYAEGGRVCLRYAGGKEWADLCQYIAEICGREGCEVLPEGVMAGNVMECDCPFSVLNAVAIQAAELRGRLKAIEDILGQDYDLDGLRELVEADRDGRFMVLPCKVGDYVYFLVPNFLDGGIDMEKIIISEVGSKGFWVSKYTAKPHEMHDFTPWEELGVSVFLTREEAEAALRKRGDGDG